MKVIIYGSGGQGKVAAQVLKALALPIQGIIDDDPSTWGKKVLGCPVLGVYGPTDPRVNRPWGVPFRAVHPARRAYTGIKKIDRRAGGFDGLDGETVRDAALSLLDEARAHRRR